VSPELLHEAEGKHVLVVTHSGSLRVILAHVLGAPLPTIRRFSMPYTSWSRVIYDGKSCSLEYLNRSGMDVAHASSSVSSGD